MACMCVFVAFQHATPTFLCYATLVHVSIMMMLLAKLRLRICLWWPFQLQYNGILCSMYLDAAGLPTVHHYATRTPSPSWKFVQDLPHKRSRLAQSKAAETQPAVVA